MLGLGLGLNKLNIGATAMAPTEGLLYKEGALKTKDHTYFIDDLTGNYVSEVGHIFQNTHLVGNGITAIYFYAGLDTKWIRYYNIDTLTWVEVAYNHSTGLILANGLKVQEIYTENGDVYPCEEVNFHHLYNLKGENHATIDATGATLETFRAGRNDLISQWANDYRGKMIHSCGFSTAQAASGAVSFYRFTDPSVLTFDVTVTYNIVTSPLEYDFYNTENDGTGDGYGIQVQTDKFLSFYRKDAGVKTILATTTNTYDNQARVEFTYSTVNNRFLLKAYKVGSSNPDDTDNIIDNTYEYDLTPGYQYVSMPNGGETATAIVNGVPVDINDGTWTILGTIIGFHIPAKSILSTDELPIIECCKCTDESGTVLDAEGGALEKIGRVKAELQLINASAILPNGTDNNMTLTHANVANIDNIKAFLKDTTWQEVTAFTDLYSISGTTLTLFNDTGYFNQDIAWFKAYDSEDALLFDIDFNSHAALADDNKILAFDKITGIQLELLGTIVAGNIVTQDAIFANLENGFKLWTKDSDATILRTPIIVTSVTGYTLQSTNISYANRIINAENKYRLCREPRLIDNDVSNFFYDGSNVPQELDYVDFVANVGSADKIFMRISALSKDRLLFYKDALTGLELSRAEKYTGQ